MSEFNDFLEARKISVEVAAKLGVTAAGSSIAFPYTATNGMGYRKLRTPQKEFRCDPSGVPQDQVWNHDCLAEEPGMRDPLIITEGEFDALACLTAGYQFVVSIPSGAIHNAKLTPERNMLSNRQSALRYLVDDLDGKQTIREEFCKFSKIVILADADAPGQSLLRGLVAVLSATSCFVVTYPDGCKDANDVLIRYGEAALRAMIDAAMPASRAGRIIASEAFKSDPEMAYLETGIDWLSNNFKPVMPGVTVIGGLPNAGKSTVRDFLALSLCWQNPSIRMALFNAEGSSKAPVENAMKFWNVKNSDRSDTEKALDRTAWIDHHLSILRPDRGQKPTLEWLTACIKQQALAGLANLFIIDPWISIKVEHKKGVNTTYSILDAVDDIYTLAADLGVMIWLVHHTKPNPNRRDRDHLAPDMHDLADSQSFSRKADHVLMVWAWQGGKNERLLRVLKSKNYAKSGHLGDVWISLDTTTFAVHPLGYDPIRRAKDSAAFTKDAKEQKAKVDKSMEPASGSYMIDDDFPKPN